jgi:hypothetical protein
MKNLFCPATAVLGGVALSFVIPTEANPDLPATHHQTGQRMRLSFKERRMKCANATKIHRKSGVA